MAKPPSPLVGFNNNVKHKGRIFHVQTEDSGIKRPHIVTHLFADGGRILKSTRTDYSEHLGRTDMHTVVRRMMKEQHKAMFIALRDGQLDDVINRNCGPLGDEPPLEEIPVPVSAAPDKPPPSKRKSKPPPSLPDMPLAEALALPADASEPSPRRAPAPTLTDLVLADLETAKTRPAVSVRTLAQSAKPPAKGTPTLGTPAMPTRVAAAARYAAPRPAAIFTPAPAQPNPSPSLFGRPSISEQSLDEVILSYLAEDLDGSPEE